MVLKAGDASAVQLEKIDKLLKDRPIPHAVVGDRATLGAAIGRASVSAVAITNASLAARMLDLLEIEPGRRAES